MMDEIGFACDGTGAIGVSGVEERSVTEGAGGHEQQLARPR